MIKKETIHIFIYQCQFLHIFEECKEDGDCTGTTNKCADDNTCKCGNTAACSGSTPVCVNDACKGNLISTSMNCVFFNFSFVRPSIAYLFYISVIKVHFSKRLPQGIYHYYYWHMFKDFNNL